MLSWDTSQTDAALGIDLYVDGVKQGTPGNWSTAAAGARPKVGYSATTPGLYQLGGTAFDLGALAFMAGRRAALSDPAVRNSFSRQDRGGRLGRFGRDANNNPIPLTWLLHGTAAEFNAAGG